RPPPPTVLGLHARASAARPHRVADVPGLAARDRDRATVPGMSPAHPRRPPHLRSRHPPGLVSRRRRRAGAAAAAVHLPRPYRPAAYLLVPVGGTAAGGTGGRAESGRL